MCSDDLSNNEESLYKEKKCYDTETEWQTGGLLVDIRPTNYKSGKTKAKLF